MIDPSNRMARTVTAPTRAGVAGLADVANALAASGQQVEDLSLRQPTLDEVFLTLTGSPAEESDADHGGPPMTTPTTGAATTAPRAARRRARSIRTPRSCIRRRASSTTCGWWPAAASST